MSVDASILSVLKGNKQGHFVRGHLLPERPFQQHIADADTVPMRPCADRLEVWQPLCVITGPDGLRPDNTRLTGRSVFTFSGGLLFTWLDRAVAAELLTVTGL